VRDDFEAALAVMAGARVRKRTEQDLAIRPWLARKDAEVHQQDIIVPT
jgi:hypothetical protein